MPESFPWEHTLEGADDMPAHVKATLTGPSLTLPIAGGRPALGTWQGIYLCEHRDRGGARALVATLWETPRSAGSRFVESGGRPPSPALRCPIG